MAFPDEQELIGLFDEKRQLLTSNGVQVYWRGERFQSLYEFQSPLGKL